MIKKWIPLVLLCMCECVNAQTTYSDELRKLIDVSKLPEYRCDRIEQLSSYDRTGKNDDGFSGRYSYIRKQGDEFVIADLTGPGVVNRIWTPTPAQDTIRFYFDGESTPRINMPFIDLFTSNRFPFVEPLCSTEIGGYFCYLPISYKKSLKIIYKGSGLKFHQIQYRTLPPKSKIESYSDNLMSQHRDMIEQVSEVWSGSVNCLPEGVQSEQIDITLVPNQKTTLFSHSKGGRILGVEFDAVNVLQQTGRNIWLSANWDEQDQLAMNLPLADFLGYTNGRASMQSLLCGTRNGKSYCYLPMPFERSAELSLYYHKVSGGSNVQLRATVYYSNQPLDKKTEGRFYAVWNRCIPKEGEPFEIANIKGKGHYVGTSLIAQGLDAGMTLFWEGDDRSTVDGELRFHGTGSEDYFNGGWYAVMDRWDRAMSCPLHGALEYDLKNSRTGGYRFLLSDKINFEKSYNLTIEHGPEDNLLPVDYASVGYFYAERPEFVNTTLNDHSIAATRLNKHLVLAQDFTTRLYWFTSLTMQDGYAVIKSIPTQSWMTNIDFEAVPMIQFDLEGIANGKYRLSLTYSKQQASAPFTVWQRTRQISEWIDNCASDNAHDGPTTIEVGQIEITDQLKTVTFRRKKADQTTVQLHSLILEPIL